MSQAVPLNPPAPRPRVLLVDDEPAILRAHVRVFTTHGYEVETACDGSQAALVLQHREFDVVVSDLHMPVMNGLDLLRKARAVTPDLPFIFITGNPDAASASRAMEHGAFRYFAKPFEYPDLLAAVELAARHRREQQAERNAAALARSLGLVVVDRDALAARLSRAIERLWMAYQPIVDLAQGRVFAYEALMRSAEVSLATPPAVLEAAEKLGALSELGRRIRRTVAAASAAPPDTLLFVNLHTADLLDEDLFSPESPLSAHSRKVVLEITERAGLEETSELPQRLARLRALGYRLAIDDLGAGYAGLTSVARVQPEYVKLDMSLVRDVHREPMKQRLVRAMVAVCADAGAGLIAEGVETQDERQTLESLGCRLLQGYLFGRPGAAFEAAAGMSGS